MKNLPLSKQKKATKKGKFNPKPFIERLEQLMSEKNLSMRQVGIESGLDHQVIRRLKEVHAKRPNMTYCILLADYFGINPNEFLQLAGWPSLKVFDIKRASIDNLPPEAVDVALDIAKIPDPRTRKQVADAVRVLLKKYFS
jgi:transcriptional regulator with XRE-family HTH domain